MPEDRPRGDRQPNPVDRHVGERVRARRKQLGLSQDKLAEALGLTFQQVQKYERGVNRISASKLFEAAGALSVEVPFFFDGLQPAGGGADGVAEPAAPAFEALVLTPEDTELLTAFRSIRGKRMRRRVMELVRELAQEGSEAGAD
jgi:transcriptional regulator with XRE-family HTH domain